MWYSFDRLSLIGNSNCSGSGIGVDIIVDIGAGTLLIVAAVAVAAAVTVLAVFELNGGNKADVSVASGTRTGK